MPRVSFTVEGAAVVELAATPTIAFKIGVVNDGPEAIHSIALRCQLQLEPARRRYTPAEQKRLLDLFGEVSRWGQTVHPMLWSQANVTIPAFHGTTVCDLPVACTFDFNVAATKYFYGLDSGALPVRLQFSGTVFYLGEHEELQAAPISWADESRFELPVSVWQQMMDAYYPDSAWLRVRRDIFDRIYQYKVDNMILSWEETMERLLPQATVTAAR